MRNLAFSAMFVFGLLTINQQPAQAQTADSPAPTRGRSAFATTQPAERESGTMQDQPGSSKTGAASQPATQPSAGNPRVVMQTSMGKIVLELYPDKAPITVENFLKYVDSGFYNGTIFHRVISNFMVQGGGFGADKTETKTDSPIKNEASNGLKNERGTVAMARTNDPNSATAQFFVNVKDNAFLNYSGTGPRGAGYAVFGKVVEGMDVVDKIKETPTGTETFVTRNGPMPFEDAPKTAVVIESVKRQ